MNERAFLGSGVKFPLQIDPKTGTLALVSDEEDIVEAIKIILGTYRGERVMRPTYGTNIRDYLFAPSGSQLHETM
ncbi:MAG: GPW/gp25 family protein, partial [Oscillospiraceae bacterium]|nr:GPW/gp25 family protein [Oscillospiraceae bacterium]